MFEIEMLRLIIPRFGRRAVGLAVPWIALALLLATPAAAQIQGGPNIAPNGMRFTYSPRFGYLGPPVAFVPYGPPVQNRAMPMVLVPREEPPPPIPPPLASPPVRRIEPGARQARPAPPIVPAPRLPGQRQRPPVPCPDGCPREPEM